MFYFNSGFSQTLNFSFVQSSAQNGGFLRMKNLSTGFPSNQDFKWIIENGCGNVDTLIDCIVTTKGVIDTATMYIWALDSVEIKLEAVGFSGNFKRAIPVGGQICVSPCTDIGENCEYICNGSFEYLIEVNGDTPPISGPAQLHLACPWTQPIQVDVNGNVTATHQMVSLPNIITPSSPDMYSVNSSSTFFRVPHNFQGSENEFNGDNNYAGIYVRRWQGGSDFTREYIQQQLVAPIEPGDSYTFRMLVSLNERSTRGVRLGFALTEDRITIPTPAYDPLTVSNNASNFLHIFPNTVIQKDGWEELTFTFTWPIGHNPLKYRTIGNFTPLNDPDYEDSPYNQPSNPGEFWGSAQEHSVYYIDNVSLKSLSCCPYGFNDNTVFINSTNNTASYLNAMGFNSGHNFDVSADIIMDEDIILTNCEMNFRPGTSIIVPQNRRIEFRGCHLKSCGEEMWNGIRAHQSGSEVFFIRSILEDAEIGIDIQNGATYTVSTSILNKNRIALNVQYPSYTTTNNNSSSIIQSVISCNELVNITYPNPINPSVSPIQYIGNSTTTKAPYLGETSQRGIALSNVSSINIGSSLISELENVFTNQQWGIWAITSSANIVNNRFEHSKSHYAATGGGSGQFFDITSGGAIRAVTNNNPSAVPIRTLNIGGPTPNDANVFINNGTDIYTGGKLNLNIHNNSIQGSIRSIITQNNLNNTTSTYITDNVFTDVERMVVNFKEDKSSKLFVSENIVSNTQNFAGNFDFVSAERFTSSVNTNLEVKFNDVTGIKLREGVRVSLYHNAKVQNNTIKYTATTAGYFQSGPDYRGIVISGSNNFNVTGNTIERTLTNNTWMNATWAPVLQGIWIENSINGTTCSNNAIRMGYGIQIRHNCDNMRLNLNQFTANFNGLRVMSENFGGAAPSPFFSQPSDNQWFSHLAGNRIDGNPVSPTHTWYRRASGASYGIGNVAFLYITAATPTLGNVPLCNTLTITKSDTDEDMEAKADSLVNLYNHFAFNDIDFVENKEMKNHFYQIYAYNELKNADWVNEYSQAGMLNEFVEERKTNGIGVLIDAPEKAMNGKWDEAYNSVLNYSPKDEFEHKLKTVTEIYLKTFAQDSLKIDETDYNTLFDIAMTDVTQAGVAAYMARNMLGLEYKEFDKTEKKFEIANDTQNEILIYPNPSSGDITILYNDYEGVLNIELFDISGVKVWSENKNYNQQSLAINVSHLPNGLYILQMKDGKNEIHRSKLTILK